MKKRYIYWFIIGIVCIISISAMGFMNANGVYHNQLLDYYQINLKTYTTITLLASIIGSFLATCLVRLLNDHNRRIVMICLVCCYLIDGATIFLSKNLILFACAHLLFSITNSMCTSLLITTLINNWFFSKSSIITSFCFAFSGVGGTIASTFVAYFLENHGFTFGYLSLKLAIFLIMLPIVIFVPFKPEQVGLEPYEIVEEKKLVRSYEIPFKKSSVIFIMVACFSFLTIFFANIYNYIPAMLQDSGFSISQSAQALSNCMLGNTISKILFGLLAARYGERRILTSHFLISGVGMFGLLFLSNDIKLVYLFSFLYGFCHSISSVGIPVMVRYIFDSKKYTECFSTIAFIDLVSNYLLQYFVSFVYDSFSDYQIAFKISLLAGVLALSCLNIVLTRIKSESQLIEK